MFTPLEIYKRFLLKVNKNDTNGNIKIPKSQFVIIFNEAKRNWIDQKAKILESNDYIEDLAFLLELDAPLTKVSSTPLTEVFKIPSNFFSKTSSYSVASKGDCKDKILVNWFVKPKDINVLLQNSNQSPSFEYQETLAILNKDNITVYKDNFNIDQCYLSYYREPLDIDIDGYTKIDGTASQNIATDLDNISTEEVLELAAIEALKNYESIEQLQIALQKQK